MDAAMEPEMKDEIFKEADPNLQVGTAANLKNNEDEA